MVNKLLTEINKKPVKNKYGARRVEVDGHNFDSKREAQFYGTLRLREVAGEITDLELQPVYPLLIEGIKVGFYRADFKFWDKVANSRRVIDVKGVDTPVSRLKRKMVSAIYGIDVEVVK